MKRIVLTILACFAFNAPANAQVRCTSMGFASGAAGTAIVTPNPNPNAATSIKAPTGSARIFICGYAIQAVGGTAQLVYGTGTTCGTGTTPLSPIFATTVPGQDTSPNFRGLLVPNGADVCLVAGAGATASQAIVYYVLQ
jgi:hypothetical protein